MRTLLCGEIIDFVPSFNAYLGDNGNLVFDEKGDSSLTVMVRNF